MAQETKVEEKTCSFPMFERNNYFFGKAVTVGDFKLEQQYGIGKSRLLNQLIHGTGILCGMQISDARIADGKFTIEISEGAALDCCGNLIVASKTDRVEVQGSLAEGPNYLYIKFSECVRQPIMAAANASSCEEVCCYNRIRESFEIFATGEAPNPTRPTFTGAVKRSDEVAIVGAKVEALQNGIVQGETSTNNDGTFELGLLNAGGAKTFDVRASATGFRASIQKERPVSSPQPTLLNDFVLDMQSGAAPSLVCNEVTQKYFEEHSLACSHCDDPRVFLAVAIITGDTVAIDTESDEIRRTRSVVYTNPMLHDLLCHHLADFNNPHRTTAEQVQALQSINNVGNLAGRAYVSNINLVSKDTTIGVTPDPDSDNRKVDLKLANDSVRRTHLNNDTINSLLSSDGTITIEPDTANKRIEIKTSPAANVTSVGAAKVVGASTKMSSDAHAHDLGNGVVTKPKLADEVVNTLLASNGTIIITPNAATKTIAIATRPATVVSSVGKEKKVGTSLNFSPDDHIHNFNINEKGPDANGQFRLTPGANVTIAGGADNELIIGATVSQAFRVTNGLVRFSSVREGEFRSSPLIKAELDSKLFAIVLGLEDSERKIGEIGALAAEPNKKASPPLLVAVYFPSTGDGSFRIDLKDTRSAAQPPANPAFVNYFVRWWAIPSTSELATVEAPPIIA